MNSDLENKLDLACQAVRTGGEFILQNRFTALKKYMKGDEGDFATELDISTEKVIKDILQVKYPEIPIIGEETGRSGEPQGKETWYVDPLDGTKAFFQGNVAFTSVSVALTTSEEVLVGAVYNPFTDTLYAATKESKTTVNDHPVNSELFPSKLSESRMILDFDRKLSGSLKKALLELELTDTFSRIFRYEGSVAQHLCLIGSGVHQGGIFWGKSNKGHFWDIGAGILICRQAGLKITNFQGKMITSQSNNFSQILVSSKNSHGELLRIIEELLPLDI